MLKPKTDEEKVFSPSVINIMLALLAGIVLPLAFQNMVATTVSNLSTAPVLINGQIEQATNQDVGLAGIVIAIIAMVYVVLVAYQIRFIAILQSHFSVFAFAITVVGPFVIWLGLPFILQSFNS
jgi:hypothetical protein